jgi:hypothetical protein
MSLFVWLVADGWCWFVQREKYCWLVADGWFVLREKYCWLVADKPNEQGEYVTNVIIESSDTTKLRNFRQETDSINLKKKIKTKNLLKSATSYTDTRPDINMPQPDLRTARQKTMTHFCAGLRTFGGWRKMSLTSSHHCMNSKGMKRFVSVCDQQQLTPPPKLMMGSCTSDEG